jgi:hypothetical protein
MTPMPSLPTMPRSLGLLCLALLFAAVFVVALPGQTVWQRAVMDAGHGPVFGAIAVVLLLLQEPAVAEANGRRHAWRQYGVAFVLAIALGALSEWLQRYLPNRNVSLDDLLHDALGAACGLGVLALLERRRTGASGRPITAALGALVLATLLGLVWAPLQCAWAYAGRYAAFPTLAPLGPVADGKFILAHAARLSHVALPERWRQDGEGDALRLDFAVGSRPALELTEFARDWRGWETLALDVTNPGPAPASFMLRLLDAHHDWTHEDRLNLPVVIPPETRTTLRVSLAAVAQAPERREMDLAAVANLMLFSTAPTGNETFYVSRIWLE